MPSRNDPHPEREWSEQSKDARPECSWGFTAQPGSLSPSGGAGTSKAFTTPDSTPK